MAAKIIMVIEYQDFCIAARCLPKKIRGTKAADAATDNDQVVLLAAILAVPACAIPDLVRGLERTRM